MTKKEIVWRELLYQARVNRKMTFTQKELAERFGVSLSTVFNALKVPRDANIVRVTGRFFALESYTKLLYLWASNRSLKRDMIFEGYAPQSVSTLEGVMPPRATFGLYSAFKFAFHTAPADYDHLYVYAAERDTATIISRTGAVAVSPKSGTPANVFILEADQWLGDYSVDTLPLEQLFVDLWNAPEWYAKDFIAALKRTLDL